MKKKIVVGMTTVATIAIGLIFPFAASAQQASGIAGMVKDTSGAVLPGVTVEAASAALIERVRTAVTDSQGQYKILDLRPGTYTVTFTLTGFTSVKTEGIELVSGFIATINGDMRVGSIEETITVSGESPLVDTRSSRQSKPVSNDLLNVLPSSGKAVATIANLIPGMAGTTDVGGSAGTYASNSPRTNTFHGKGGVKLQYDGMRVNNMVGAGDSTGYMTNPATVQEISVEIGGGSAESAASGVSYNLIPKEGGNRFSGDVSSLFTNKHFQSDNLTQKLRDRKLTSVNKVVNIYDFNMSFGGPIQRNKLWFFGAFWTSGSRNQLAGLYWNKTQGTPVYTPDLSRPSNPYEHLFSYPVRLTWQASARNKLNFFSDLQKNCTCGRSGFNAPEADVQRHFWPQGLFQVAWSSPVTTKLLVEAGASTAISHWPTFPTTPLVTPDTVAILEQSTGLLYNAATTYNNPQDSDRYSQRGSVAYVTGSHAFKTGFQLEEGIVNTGTKVNQDMTFRFMNGSPNLVTEFATPYLLKVRMRADLGVFAQDQWTTKRLTLNYGVRFDYFNGYVPAQSVPAGRFVPAREFAAVPDVPDWKDLNPRLGAAYDLFGDGKTALKFSAGRYLGIQGVAITTANNPITTTLNSVSRTWTDSNQNFIVDCDLTNPAQNDECGVGNVNFGKSNVTTKYTDEAIRGFGHRDYFWDVSTELQREIAPGISANAGYYRSWFGNFLVTDNLLATPADYSPYCITAPLNPQLPGGGGYPVCGLYDISPSLFNKVNNLVKPASAFGNQSKVNDFVSFNLNTKFKSDLRLGGGVDTGRTVTDNCFVVDSPQLLYCHVVSPFKANTQIKVFGSYPLPQKFTLSAAFQNTSGPDIQANFAASNDMIKGSLGRDLAAGPKGTATVPLIAPQTIFEGRRTQLDLRLSKIFPLGSRRLQANIDAYNIFNASPVLAANNTYGPQWRVPSANGNTTAILNGRLIEFSGRLSF